MTTAKILLPLLALTAGLGGCVYEEVDTGYREPRRVYHSGYDEREVVVEQDRPRRYRDDRSDYYRDNRSDYYRERPVTVYNDQPRVVYGGGYVVAPGHRGGESYQERQERQLREAQRAQEEHHDKKDDDHKKKKKKKEHDDN